MLLWTILPVLVLVMVVSPAGATTSSFKQNISIVDESGVSTVELARARGFLAENFTFTTRQGYQLNVIRINNPLINGGEPGGLANKSVVLFIHALMTNSGSWVRNSLGAKPKNYGHLSAAHMTDEELTALLGEDPTSNSFCLTLVNFGHECWLYDRRGTLASQGFTDQLSPTSSKNNHTNRFENVEPPASANLLALGAAMGSIGLNLTNASNKRYWDYSYDEQASEDLPQLLDWILEKTGRRSLTLVGYSAGGAIATMALARRLIPKEKLRHVMLWAPAMELGHDKSSLMFTLSSLLEPLLVAYRSPLNWLLMVAVIRLIGVAICNPLLLSPGDNCRQLLMDVLVGPSGGQTTPMGKSNLRETFSSHELDQLGSSARKMRMDMFDLLLPHLNELKYGQPKPPTYNISNINVGSLSVWYGNKDALVTPADSRDLLSGFSIDVDEHFINVTGIFFNHLSFAFHKNVSRLLNIPALKRMEQDD